MAGGSSTLQTQLNAGELSPLLYGRTDLARYAAGARYSLNMLPLAQGPSTRRPGSQFLGSVQNHDKRSWLARFVFGPRDAWLIEFGDSVLRLWTDGGLALSGGSPILLTTPYAATQLVDEDGCFRLRLAQAGDLSWIASGQNRVRLLKRLAVDTWTIEIFTPEGGPWEKENTGTTTVYASAATGSVTLTASSAIFTSAHVDSLFRIWSENPAGVRPWEAQQNITATGELRRSDGKVYKALNTGWTGNTRPTHTRGKAFDASDTIPDPDGSGSIAAGIEWEYQHAGYGWVEITGFTSSTVVTGTVKSRLPADVVGSGNATTRWQFGAWGGSAGWPLAVGFAFDRLVFARGRTLWMSRTDDFFSFHDRSHGQVLADDGLTLTLTGPEINEIRWLQDTAAGLVIGTDGGEYLLSKQNGSQVLGAVTDGTRNVQVQRQTSYGVASVRPAAAHGRTLFIQAGNRSLRELTYRLETDRLGAADLSIIAEHMLEPGIVDMAWQGTPDNVLWLALADGTLATLTYMPEQEVLAWSRHQLGGAAIVESVETIPTQDGSRYEVWLAVRRTINGAVRRYVERLAGRWRYGANVAAQEGRFLDSWLAYDGAPAATFSGATHLHNQIVACLADGTIRPRRTIGAGGTYELDQPASKGYLGLPYTSQLEGLPPPGGDAMGPTDGRRVRTRRVGLLVLESGPYETGRGDGTWRRGIDERARDLPLGSAPPLVTGWQHGTGELGHNERQIVAVRTDEPQPLTIAAKLELRDAGNP